MNLIASFVAFVALALPHLSIARPQEDFFDSFLDNLLTKGDQLRYTAVNQDGTILTPAELRDVKDMMRENFVEPFAGLARHRFFNWASRQAKINRAARDMMKNREILQPYFNLIQRSREDVLAELLTEQNQHTQRAYWRVADILDEPEIDIHLDNDRMILLMRAWNERRGNKVTFRTPGWLKRNNNNNRARTASDDGDDDEVDHEEEDIYYDDEEEDSSETEE